jgi:hypothetical protein
MIFGLQMYHEEMEVKFEYGCCPIIIWEVIALGLRKRIENDSFQVKFEYGCSSIIISPLPTKSKGTLGLYSVCPSVR